MSSIDLGRRKRPFGAQATANSFCAELKKAILVSAMTVLCGGLALDLPATPFQLLELESATINRPGHFEIEGNTMYETAPVPVAVGQLGLRFAFWSRGEIILQHKSVYFVDEKEFRFSDVTGGLKFHIWKARPNMFNLFVYGKYRYALGEALILPHRSDKHPNVIGVVSAYADHGRDTTIGILGRNGINWNKTKGIFMVGLEYIRAEGRDYGDFTDKQKNIFALLFVPEFYLDRQHLWMFAMENRFVYWPNRGYMYTFTPQFRWEFQPFRVVELGVALPVLGAENNYRFNLGINLVY